jgi:hypothetical protein
MGGTKLGMFLAFIIVVMLLVLHPHSGWFQEDGPVADAPGNETQKAGTAGEYRGGTGIIQQASDESRAREIMTHANNSLAINTAETQNTLRAISNSPDGGIKTPKVPKNATSAAAANRSVGNNSTGNISK